VVSQRHGDTWSSPHVLGRGTVGGVVIDRTGSITVAWEDGRNNAIVRAARQVSGNWQRARTLGQGVEPDLAANRHGDVALTWATDRGIGVAVLRKSAGCWAASAHVKGIRWSDDPQVVIDDRGRVVVLWARSPEEENYATRHLAWAQSNGDGNWTSARYLDTRQRREVIGDYVDLAMNARGQAVAAWVAESKDNDLRVARFGFGHGWSSPSRLTGFPFEPAAMMARSGTPIVILHASVQRGWAFQQPNGAWTLGDRVAKGIPLDAYGAGQRAAVLYRAKGNLTARFLVLRPNRPR
jgi:hypothetical protein